MGVSGKRLKMTLKVFLCPWFVSPAAPASGYLFSVREVTDVCFWQLAAMDFLATTEAHAASHDASHNLS